MKKLFIVFAILCLATPAMAADWNFYGSARMATFYSIVDKDIPGDNDTVNRTLWDLQGNSRFGATVKVNDQIGGGFEYGTGVNLRKLYGTYTFGGGSELLLGQTYVPTGSYFYSNSVFDSDGDLLGVGQFYTGRIPMVQWKTGGLKIALVKPNVPDDVEAGEGEFGFDEDGNIEQGDPTVGVATDLIIPKIEASYKFKGDAWFMDVYGGFQTFGLDYFEGNDPTITSYVVGLGGGMNFGAFYVNLGGHWVQNAGDYGAYGPELGGLPAIDGSAAIDDNQNEVDNTGYGFLGVLGWNVSDMWTLEAGYGYQYYELDVDGADGESLWQAYVNAVINITPGFFVVPEIGYASYDYEDGRFAGEGDPNPNILYVGAKWQINF
jgi:hypothetical protein